MVCELNPNKPVENNSEQTVLLFHFAGKETESREVT
jgi:hypothetical protein